MMTSDCEELRPSCAVGVELSSPQQAHTSSSVASAQVQRVEKETKRRGRIPRHQTKAHAALLQGVRRVSSAWRQEVEPARCNSGFSFVRSNSEVSRPFSGATSEAAGPVAAPMLVHNQPFNFPANLAEASKAPLPHLPIPVASKKHQPAAGAAGLGSADLTLQNLTGPASRQGLHSNCYGPALAFFPPSAEATSVPVPSASAPSVQDSAESLIPCKTPSSAMNLSHGDQAPVPSPALPHADELANSANSSPSSVEDPAAPILDAQLPATSAERVLQLMKYGRDRCVQVLRKVQTIHSDGGTRDRSRGEGNRPRMLYCIPMVQDLLLEIVGKLGLNLYDSKQRRLKNQKTGQVLQNLQRGWPEEARDLLEELCVIKLSGHPTVKRLLEAADGPHFLETESVRQACLTLTDRLLAHLQALDKEPERDLGDWSVYWTEDATEFVRQHLHEFMEVDVETGKVEFTHYRRFLTTHRGQLPRETTRAKLVQIVTSLTQKDLTPLEWAEHTLKVKKAIDAKCGRNGRQLSRDWRYMTGEELVDFYLMHHERHPLRREDRLLRLTTATTNPHALHHGLSSASLDKIVDGGGEEFPGYRIKDSGFKEVYAEFLADPENFVMTYSKVRQIGNVQLTLLFDNLAKGVMKFRVYAAFGVEVGQFDLARYAEYFELSTVEEAQADVERRHKKSENKARAGVDGESHEKSWFGGQMWRAKGERTRTKGRQLREHVELEHVERVFELQQRSCWATGQSIFLGKGGRKTPWTAAVELAPARTFHLVSSCLARGRASCPVEVFKDFLEYWGVSGHQYFQHLRIVGNGEVEDLQAGDVSEILGQDTSGERLAEARGSEGGDPGSGEEGRSGSESDGEGREEVASPAQHHLPFGGIDWTWGALRGPLSSSTGSGGGKYRRRGLSLNQASPALAGVELEADAMLDMTWRYRSPVLTRLEEHEGGATSRTSGPRDPLVKGPTPRADSGARMRVSGPNAKRANRIDETLSEQQDVSQRPEAVSRGASPSVDANVSSVAGSSTAPIICDSIVDPPLSMAAFPALAAFLPPGSRRAVAVGQADMDSLEPLNFLTTNIVEFYGLYLLEQFPAIGANSVLVPPIVWDKLSQLVGRPNALDRGSLSTKLVRVLRTPDAAKLLEAPHAFMLVYHRCHFSLVVLANPASDEGPYALHLDSDWQGGHHASVEATIRRLLSAARASRAQGGEPPRTAIHSDYGSDKYPFIKVKVPQQPNGHDCGLFALQNLECLLQNIDLIDKMQDSAKDFGTLYDPEMAINKRSQIRTLIHRLVDQSASGTPVDTGDPVSPEADGLQSVLPERESSKCLPADKHRSKDSGALGQQQQPKRATVGPSASDRPLKRKKFQSPLVRL